MHGVAASRDARGSGGGKRTAAAAAAVWSTDAQQDAQTPIPSAARRTKQQGREAACVSLPEAGALGDGQLGGPITAHWGWNVCGRKPMERGAGKGRTSDGFIIGICSRIYQFYGTQQK